MQIRIEKRSKAVLHALATDPRCLEAMTAAMNHYRPLDGMAQVASTPANLARRALAAFDPEKETP